MRKNDLPNPTQPLDDLVETWFRHHFHNSAASRHTDIYNQIHAAKADLKARLYGLLGHLPAGTDRNDKKD